ncbi:hypothetical protein DICPUDRAFT_77679 [Dictyostelium purpureum]|uniref:Ubiquitin carboxyl-terminal hydrolase n=1 Tax=Dictyostelium purpureum TaxID=5786 RepID=F0ZHB5_DICPU|nr:uncharacterized protein DICPUDRAFT_77679 [Dictyostelium purpureum]EGC36657.1 hypothetical protein DICPUDRAFT_77679 [Dictyostelium purpureum]|eukprot:XP_003286825.1 hypothetical protein DICPUDRAFT_77679 [Dictyostelium purpureum]
MGNSQSNTDLEKLYEKYEFFPRSQKLFGFENFGNTCYCNSVLQVLYFCVPFRNRLLKYYCEVKGLPPFVPYDIDDLESNNNNNNNNNNSDNSNKSKSEQDNNNCNNVNIYQQQHQQQQQLIQQQLQQKRNSSAQPIGYQRNINQQQQVSPQKQIPSHQIPQQQPSQSSFFSFNILSFLSGGSGTQSNNGLNSPTTTSSSGNKTSREENLIIHLGELFYTIHQNRDTYGCLKPERFVDRLKRENEMFSNYNHQDAHEFLNFLLNSIAEYLQKQQKQQQQQQEKDQEPDQKDEEKKEFKSFVHEIFEGILTNETKCLTCESITNKDESFLDLSIDIEKNKSLTSCLSNFSSVEVLSKNNKFFCDKYKKLPNTLIIHLKRFKYSETVQQYTKLNYRVVFPFETIIQNTTSDLKDYDRKYNLFAVVIHVGSGPNRGHYYSLIKCHGVWFLFDDDNIDIREEADIHECFGSSNEFSNDCGYLLFYQLEPNK